MKDPDTDHLDHTKETPGQEATMGQDQVLTQDQDPIDQDLTAIIDLATETRIQNQRLNINVVSMGKELIIQQ